MIDYSTLAPATVPLEIRNPATGKPTGIVLNLRSMDSEPARNVKLANSNKQMMRRNRKLTAADLEEGYIDLLVVLVESWEWKGDAAWRGGKKPDFKPDVVREVVSTPWIRNQIAEVTDDEAAFFEK